MSDLKLRVKLEDKASEPLKKVSDNVKSFADQFKNATPHVEGATASILRFATGVAVGNLATLAARKAVNALGQEYRKTIAAANKMQSALIGLSSVSAAFGESQLEARDAAKSLSEDGLMSVTSSAEGLKNLLATGFNLEEAIELMDAFKDSAAFNRQGTLEFGQAIVGATQGIKNQNSIMVDNAGITKNLSVIMKEAGLKVEDMGRIATDAGVRQKFLNGILKEAAIFKGDAARAADTLKGAQSQLTTSVFNLRSSIGLALSPALRLMVSGIRENVDEINNGITPALESFAKGLVRVIGFIQGAGLAISTLISGVLMPFKIMLIAVAGSVKTLATALFELGSGRPASALKALNEGVKQTGDSIVGVLEGTADKFQDFGSNLGKISSNVSDTIAKIEKEGLSGFTDIARDALSKTAQAISEAAKKIRDAIEKENERFKLTLEKQARAFNESLRDMVISHREKTEELESDIEDENATFKERMAERVADFKKSMGLMEDRHGERVERIQDQLKKEEKAISDAIEKLEDKNKEQMEQFRIAGQERINSLQRQLDIEISRSRTSDNKKISNLRTMIVKEKKALSDQANTKSAILNKEIQKEKDSRKERIDDLKEELDEENLSIVEAREEKETEYEKETDKLKREHQKRTDSLVEQLNAEREIRRRHAEDFATFQDAVREDDLARLKRKHAEQNKLEEDEHQRRLRDISKRAQEENATRAAAQVRTDTSRQSQATQQVTQAVQSVKQTGQQMSQALQTSIAAPTFAQPQVSGASAQMRAGGGGFFQGLTNIASNIFSGIKGFFGFQHGGEFTVGGQGGPDSQMVAFKASPGEQVIIRKPGESASGRNITINMPVQVMSSELDMDLIAERLVYNLNKAGTL